MRITSVTSTAIPIAVIAVRSGRCSTFCTTMYPINLNAPRPRLVLFESRESLLGVADCIAIRTSSRLICESCLANKWLSPDRRRYRRSEVSLHMDVNVTRLERGRRLHGPADAHPVPRLRVLEPS